MTRYWLWTLIALDAVILFPAFYMASQAVGIVGTNKASMGALGVAALFMALPVFCLAAPYAAWRTHSMRGEDENAVALAAMPILYAACLTLFVFWQ